MAKDKPDRRSIIAFNAISNTIASCRELYNDANSVLLTYQSRKKRVGVRGYKDAILCLATDLIVEKGGSFPDQNDPHTASIVDTILNCPVLETEAGEDIE